MGRIARNNLMYFSHDADAFDHPKFITLRAHYGGEKGRAMEQRFWQLNGMIAKSEACRLDTRTPFVKPSLAQKLDLSLGELDEFLTFLSDPKQCDLINNEDGVIWTDRCNQDLSLLNASRESDRKRKMSGRKKVNSDRNPAGELPFSDGSPGENTSIPEKEQSRAEQNSLEAAAALERDVSGRVGRK